MSDRRGVALLLVLWLIVALAAVSSGALVAARRATGVAGNYRARAVARYAAESGITLALATLEDALAGLDPSARREYLNHLDAALGGRAEESLGDARLEVTLDDVGARLDVNAADASALARLFSFFTDPVQAERAAAAVRTFIAGGRAAGAIPEELAGGAGGSGGGLSAVRPLRSLDELLAVPGMPAALARRARGFLTVDGDGTINRATASDTVLAAAAGELRDEPSRILITSRGRQDGHPLTHEIEAVYAVAGTGLVLVRWRERDL